MGRRVVCKPLGKQATGVYTHSSGVPPPLAAKCQHPGKPISEKGEEGKAVWYP